MSKIKEQQLSPDQPVDSNSLTEFGNASWLPDLEQRLPGESIAETMNKESVSRRSFLKIMGASLALMGMTSCRRPLEEIVPFVKAPEDAMLGKPEQYATTMALGTSVYGLLVTSFEGRPQKIDGNPLHPSSLGGANARCRQKSSTSMILIAPNLSSIRGRKRPRKNF